MSTSDPDQWAERHKDFKFGLDADQVELRALLEGLASVDAGFEDERIAGIVDDSLIERGNSWEERQDVLEMLSGATADEIARRAEMMKEAYPFTVRGNAVTYRRSTTGIYEFCLAVAKNPKGTAEGRPHASTVFEWIARDVLALHLGAGSRGFRTGWPPHESEERGTRTKETFEILAEQCGEFRWNPAPDYPEDPTPALLKDCGLDVVVWKPWPDGDGRLAPLFALGQCACGKNDINANKGRELSMNRLGNWLRPITYATPIRCFLAALHIPNDKQLRELSQEAGLIFDRARLSMLAESSPDAVKPAAGFDYHELAAFYVTQQAA
jgi:hypothetical protein